MTKSARIYGLALLVGLCAAAISYFKPISPYRGDSANYIEQARNLLERGVFEVTPFGIEEQPDAVFVPDKLFPPGYPLLIALGSLIFRFPVEVVAPLLSLAALVLLPSVIIRTFHRVVGLWPALAIAVLSAFTPAAIKHGYHAHSDMISLVLIVYAVHRLLLAGDKSLNWFWLGLLTGFSYLIRNANLGFIIAIGLYLLWQFAIQAGNRKQLFRNAVIWACANGLLIVPWLVHNKIVFGTLQPYSMAPSTVSLQDNIHDFITAQLDTLLALIDLDAALAGSYWGLGLLGLASIALAYQVVATWRNWSRLEQQAFGIATINVAIGATIVIAARTKYQWGGLIDARYALSNACFLFVAAAIAANHLAMSPHVRKTILGITAVTLLLARAYELPKFYEDKRKAEAATLIRAIELIQNRPDSICTRLNGRFAVSNLAGAYRVACGAPVRHIWFKPSREFIEASLPTWAALGKRRGIMVSGFPRQNDPANELPLEPDAVEKLRSRGWQVERNEHENLILSREENAPQ
ncbi:MAG: glycosyltransferase family 39 protein [Gammaproteobacteria bacterium]